jgi:hypothetical protein
VLLRSFLRILSIKSLGCCGRLGCNRISLPRLDRSRGVDNTTSSYKPSPQARYLVEKMSKSEKNLVEAVNRLAAKMDSYDQRFTSLGSDISKIPSQVDLLMRSIQALQKEQVLLLHAVNPIGPSTGLMNSNGVMGSSPADGAVNTSTDSLPQQHQGDCSNNSSPAHFVHHGGSQCGGSDSEPRRHWMLKMDFPLFDGSDVRIWLDKCAI